MSWCLTGVPSSSGTEMDAINALPENLRKPYIKAYIKFKKWCSINCKRKVTEKTVLSYLKCIRRAKKYDARATRCKFITLRVALLSTVDIGNFQKVRDYLDWLVSKECCTLDGDEFTIFLQCTWDYFFLLEKVLVIFAIEGALSQDEMLAISVADLVEIGETVTVHVPGTDRSFVLVGWMYATYKKYQMIRPLDAPPDKFFLAYDDGVCSSVPLRRCRLRILFRQVAYTSRVRNFKDFKNRWFSTSFFKEMQNDPIWKSMVWYVDDPGISDCLCQVCVANMNREEEEIICLS